MPLAVRDMEEEPAGEESGLKPKSRGTGLSTETVDVFEVTEGSCWLAAAAVAGLTTVTPKVVPLAMSEARINAVRRVLLTKVVFRGEPFQRTMAPGRKPVPLTVRVKLGPPEANLF